MNDNFYISASIRVRQPDGRKRYFLARMTTKPDKVFYDWKINETDSIQTEDALSLASVRKYGILTFPKKSLIKDLREGFRNFYKKSRGKSKNAILQFLTETLDYRREQFRLPENCTIDWAEEIIGKVKQ